MLNARTLAALAALVVVMSVAMALRAEEAAPPKIDKDSATLESAALKLVFSARGGKCVSLTTQPGGVELTDKTGVFEDHLGSQSYLKSDFRRATFALKADGNALVLSADASSPELAGLTMTKRISFASQGVVQCDVTVSNGSKEARNVSLWHHQALHTKDGTTRYYIPSESGVAVLPYDPKGEPSEQWFRQPSRPWLGFAVGQDAGAVGGAFVGDWAVWDYHFCYRSNLYATLEWRTISKTLLPGQSFATKYQLVVAPGATNVQGIVGGDVIEATADGARLVGDNDFSAKDVGRLDLSVRKINERVEVPVGSIIGREFHIRWHAGYTATDSIVCVRPTLFGMEDFSLTGQPFMYEPLPGRIAGEKKLPPGRQDILYSLEMKWPLTAWAKPYYRGRLKAWILSPIVPNGDTVSLLKRFDLDYDIVSCDWSWEMNTWGMGDAYGQRSGKEAHGRDLEFGYATEDLTSDRPYDVLIIPTFIGWNTYPEKMRQAILKRVENGAGLVLITPQDCKEKPADEIALPKLSPFGGATQTNYHWYGDWQRQNGVLPPAPWTIKPNQENHPIVRGVCWPEMPMATAVSIHDYKTVAPDATVIAEAKGTPTIAVRNVGKGRVVALNWYSGYCGSSITPVEDEKAAPSWDYWEQFYNLVGRSALWAAGREPEVDVAFGAFEPPETLPITIDNRLREMDATITLIVKDEHGRVVSTSDTPVKLPAGSSPQKLVAKNLPGGVNHLEVLIKSGGFNLGWGATQVEIPKAAVISEVKATVDAVKNGDAIGAEISVNGKGGAAKLRAELRDPFGRVLDRNEQELKLDGASKATASFKVSNAVSLVVFVRAQIVIDGAVVSEKDSGEIVVTPSEPAFTDYEVVPWGFSSRRDLWAVKAAAYREFHATSGGSPSPEALRAGLVAKGDGHPPPHTLGIYFYDNEKERLEKVWAEYKAKGDKTTLTRSVCLSDPDALKKVEDLIADKVSKQKKFNPGIYFIGDESSLTAYTMEMDLDFSPKSLDDFRGWLKTRYPDVAALNAKWQTQFKDFSEIVPFTIVDVEKDANKACGWAEFRFFMELRYENVLKLIRETVKKQDPEAEVELSGTQSASSFNGIDWARLTRHVKRFVPYNINFAFDQLRCFNPGVKSSALTGYGSKGEGVKRSLWDQALHGLLSANIFWEWSVVDADLTTSQNAQDIGEVFAELRGKGIGRLLGRTVWARSPVAIYYSQPSIHAARVQKRENAPHDVRNAWCQITRDLGLQFDMLSYLQVEEGSWLKDPPKVLVLPLALAPSPKECEAFKKYVENGGVIIADMDPGVCDDRCDFRENKQLAELFGDGKTPGVKNVGKGKAVLLGKDYSEYAKSRGAAPGVEIRKEVAQLFKDHGALASVPITVGDAPLSNAETIFMNYGSARILAILKESLNGIRRTTADGVEYFDPLPAGQTIPAEKFTAKLPGAFHAYNIRSGKYLGQISAISDDLNSAEAKLYALLPYKVTELTLKTADAYGAGKVVTLDAALAVDGGAAGEHIFNVNVTDLVGNDLYYYSRNIVAEKGAAKIVLAVELNPPTGMRVTVTDVASGVKGTYELK